MNLLLMICVLFLSVMVCWKYKNLFHPLVIFNLLWLIILGLHHLQLSTLQQTFSDRSCLIFLGAILTFNLVFFLFDKKLKIKCQQHNEPNKKILTILKYMVIIIFVVEIIYSQGFPLYWKIIDSNKTYMDFGIPSLNGAFLGLVILLGTLSLVKKEKSFFLYFGIGILLLSRQVLLSMIIEAIVIYFCYYFKKISFIKLSVLFLSVVIGFSLLGNIRSGNSEIDRVFYAKPQYENLPKSFKWGYSYLTFSLSNFNNLVNKTEGFVNYGVSTLKEFLPTVVLNRLNLHENWKKNFLILPNFTVSTYLVAPYLDFGVIGVILMTAFISLFCLYFYNRLLKVRSLENSFYYAICVHNLVFLLFNNMFLHLQIMVQFIYVFIIFYQKKQISFQGSKEVLESNINNGDFCIEKIEETYYLLSEKKIKKSLLIKNKPVKYLQVSTSYFPKKIIDMYVKNKKKYVLYMILYNSFYNKEFISFSEKIYASKKLNQIHKRNNILYTNRELKEELDKFLVQNKISILPIKKHFFRKIGTFFIKSKFYIFKVLKCPFQFLFVLKNKPIKQICFYKNQFKFNLNDTSYFKGYYNQNLCFIKGGDKLKTAQNEKMCLEVLQADQEKFFLESYKLSNKNMICLEFCDWQNLNDFFKKENVSSQDIKIILKKSEELLACLKKNNIMHRDLRPDNILAKKIGNKTFLKIIDFGYATLNEQDILNADTYVNYKIKKALGDKYKPDLFKWNDAISVLLIMEEYIPDFYKRYSKEIEIIMQYI